MGEPINEQQQMGRKHVFAINGHSDFLELVRELLEEERYNVTTTNFVPRTFDQIASLQPDLLIVDLVIGKQAGWDLLERLHAEAITQGIPVVITSTDPRLLERAQAEAARYGGQSVLAKPFDLDALLSAVADLIGRA